MNLIANKSLKRTPVAAANPFLAPGCTAYLLPNSTQNVPNMITFEKPATVVRRHDDDISQTFAESLSNWVGEAGAGFPR